MHCQNDLRRSDNSFSRANPLLPRLPTGITFSTRTPQTPVYSYLYKSNGMCACVFLISSYYHSSLAKVLFPFLSLLSLTPGHKRKIMDHVVTIGVVVVGILDSVHRRDDRQQRIPRTRRGTDRAREECVTTKN